MANQEHVEILRKGSETWNKWRVEFPKKKPDLQHANLGDAHIGDANLIHADLAGADLTGTHLAEARLAGASLSGAQLSDADLKNAHIGDARLIGAVLRRADLTDANLRRSDLTNADLYGACLRRARLSSAIFRAANLRHADLCRADLRFANLTGAALSSAQLADACLECADLSRSDLCRADLTGADLTNANLSGAHLCRAVLSGADLSGANLTGARFGSTLITELDLSKARGLEMARHDAPSSVGIDTICKSKGRIPERFLQGAGVPDELIEFLRFLIGPGFEFDSCFICYSGRDEEFCKRLHSRMQAEHFRVWFAPEDIQGGKKLHEQIETAIRFCDKLLIVLSEASLQSEWVMTELRKARKAERQSGKRKLFPVRLVDFETLRDWECFDADGGKDLAVELREYLIPDFSRWKEHDPFEAAFARLLKDLKTENPAA